MQTYTDIEQATTISQGDNESARVETEDMAGTLEAAKKLAADAGLEVVVNRENDGSYDVCAFDADAPEGESVWRISIVPDDDAIRTLRREAGAAGDESMVETCDEALYGMRDAREDCARAIREAADA